MKSLLQSLQKKTNKAITRNVETFIKFVRVTKIYWVLVKWAGLSIILNIYQRLRIQTMQLLFVLPILTQLVRVAFAMDMEMPLPQCIDGSCDYLTDCELVTGEDFDDYKKDLSYACTSEFPESCYNGVNQCKLLNSNFGCRETCSFRCKHKCTYKHLTCNARSDCSHLFQCKDSLCWPTDTNIECDDDEACNTFSKCSDSVCKVWVRIH